MLSVAQQRVMHFLQGLVNGFAFLLLFVVVDPLEARPLVCVQISWIEAQSLQGGNSGTANVSDTQGVLTGSDVKAHFVASPTLALVNGDSEGQRKRDLGACADVGCLHPPVSVRRNWHSACMIRVEAWPFVDVELNEDSKWQGRWRLSIGVV